MRSPEVLEKVYLTLRSLWYYSVWGSFYTFLAYKSTILMTVLGVLGSFLTYYFLGYSIVYQRGIVDYGVEKPLAFILSGMLLAQIANPFRYNFPLHLQSFHYAYSRPIPPVLVLVRDWVAIYTQYNAYIVLVYAAALLSSGRVAPDPLSLTAFLLLWIAMNVGLNLFENGLVCHVKKGEPISMAVRFLEYVFSGQYFPLTILPEPLKNAVWLLPYFWAYLVWRKVLFEGLGVLSFEFLVLTIASVVTLLVGLAVYRSGYNKIYREGLVL